MADKGGFLSLFEDPVVGPQIGMGLLSTGLGLLTSPPNQANNAIQGGLGQISQGLYYGGRQKAKKTEEEEKRARQLAGIERFKQLLSGQQGQQGGLVAPQATLPGPSYTPGMGQPPLAPAPPAPPPGPQPAPAMGGARAGGPGGMDLESALTLAAEFPEMQGVLGPVITQLAQPKKMTRTQELLDLVHGNDEVGKRYAMRGLGEAPTLELSALEQYHKGQADRAERQLGLSAAGQAQSASNQAAARALQERGLAAQDATRALAERKFQYEQNKPPTLSPFQQMMKEQNIEPGTEEYLKAAALATPGASGNAMAQMIGAMTGGGSVPGLPGSELPNQAIAPPPPAPPPTDGAPIPVPAPEPTTMDKVKDVVGLGPEQVIPVSSLGPKEDVRLEKRLGPESANALRTMLAGVQDPAKQRQASGILRRVAQGMLGKDKAAKELEALGL